MQLLEKVLVKVGERAAILLVFIAAFFLVISETPTQAHSQEAQISFVKEDYKWFDEKFENPTVPIPETSSYSLLTATVTPTPTPVPVVISSGSDDVWEKLAQCESKGNWGINTGNGYYGGLQFSEGAWRSVGGSGLPHEHSRDEQLMRGKMLQEKRGWGPWGNCSKKLGLL